MYMASAVSEAAMRNSRSSTAGSKLAFRSTRCSMHCTASRIGNANSLARVVGCMPADVLTKSASPRVLRSRASAVLRPDWLMPRAAAASPTLRCSNTARKIFMDCRLKLSAIVERLSVLPCSISKYDFIDLDQRWAAVLDLTQT